jgi:NAD(P)H-nitrite reductase large subunit
MLAAAVLASGEMDDSESQHPALRGLKTVCRCNNVKYKTLERVIREGAWTLTQVASRTTATMGHCGGSCTPEVQEMLAKLAPKHAGLPARPVATNGPAGTTSAKAAEPDPNAWWVKKK